MLFAQEFAGRDKEAAGAAGRIADHIARRRLGQLDHQLDDVARRAELAVLPGGGDLAEHVFVDVALGVAIVHRHRSSLSTTLASSAGVGIALRASFMCLPTLPSPRPARG